MSKSQQTQVRLPLMLLPSMLMLLLLLLTLLSTSVEPVASIKTCGSQLSELLDHVCGGNFNPIPPKKRASLNLFDYVESQNDWGSDKDLDMDLDPIRVATPWGPGSLMSTRRLARGVVDECCHKSCSYKEMSKYCAY